MPLIIGVRNGIEKGFTKNDIELINGFGFGLLVMVAEQGKIEDVKEFRNRILEVNFLNEIYDKDALRNKLTVDFVQKMKDNDWSANVGYGSKRAFNTEIKRRLYEQHQTDFREWMQKEGDE